MFRTAVKHRLETYERVKRARQGVLACVTRVARSRGTRRSQEVLVRPAPSDTRSYIPRCMVGVHAAWAKAPLATPTDMFRSKLQRSVRLFVILFSAAVIGSYDAVFVDQFSGPVRSVGPLCLCLHVQYLVVQAITVGLNDL